MSTLARSPDVVIIGVGIIGASIAWKLARAGLRVTLLDAGSMGGEASWAGAGMLAPGGEVETRDAWSDLALQSLRMYPEFVAQLESESGITIDYRRCGAVEVAFDDGEWQTLVGRAELQRPLGIPSVALDGPALRERVPLFGRAAAGAMCYPDDAIVDPRDIMRTLRAASGALDIEIREGWRVTGEPFDDGGLADARLAYEHRIAHAQDDQALAEFEEAARIDPKQPFVHYFLGTVYRRRNDLERAKQEFLKDVAIEPDVA